MLNRTILPTMRFVHFSIVLSDRKSSFSEHFKPHLPITATLLLKCTASVTTCKQQGVDA